MLTHHGANSGIICLVAVSSCKTNVVSIDMSDPLINITNWEQVQPQRFYYYFAFCVEDHAPMSATSKRSADQNTS